MARTVTNDRPEQTEQERVERRETSAKQCVHHWRIESPNGRESHGVCKRCGTTRSFSNSNEAVMWEQTNTLRSDLRSPIRSTRTSDVRLSDEE